MAFDRKDYGMNKVIPLVKIADRVEVTVDLKAKRVSGPPVVFTSRSQSELKLPKHRAGHCNPYSCPAHPR